MKWDTDFTLAAVFGIYAAIGAGGDQQEPVLTDSILADDTPVHETADSAFTQQQPLDQIIVDTPDATEVQNQTKPEIDMTPYHEPTGCEAYSSSEGSLKIVCFGDPSYFGDPSQGDPNAGMVIDIDLKTAQMNVENNYEIAEDGQVKENKTKQTYDLSFTKDAEKAKAAENEISSKYPSLTELKNAEQNKNSETDLYQQKSENGNLSITILHDTSEASKSVVVTEYNNPIDGSQTTVTSTHNNVMVETSQPGEAPRTAFVDIDKASFTAADFRNTQTSPKAPAKSGPGM